LQALFIPIVGIRLAAYIFISVVYDNSYQTADKEFAASAYESNQALEFMRSKHLT